MSARMTRERRAEIESVQLGAWYSGEWCVRHPSGNTGPVEIVHSSGPGDTVLATLPDFAVDIAVFIADAHEAVPELLADNARLRRQVAVLEFNAAHPVGTPVVVYPGCRPEDVPGARRIETRTKTAAWLANGQTPVVMVEDYSSWVALTHVDAIPAVTS